MIYNSGYINSKKIFVFPCANRGLITVDEGKINPTPYSQLLTEYNLTHTNGIIGNFDSYVIKNVQTNDAVKFIAVIGGYLFSIPEGLDVNCKYIGINVSAGAAGVDGTLQPLTGTKLDDNNIFYGAYFSDSATALTGYSYVLNVKQDTSAIARYNSSASQLELN